MGAYAPQDEHGAQALVSQRRLVWSRRRRWLSLEPSCPGSVLLSLGRLDAPRLGLGGSQRLAWGLDI